LRETGESAAEVPFRRKDGTAGYWLVDAVALSPTRFLAFTVETTDRKTAELALQSTLHEKEALLKEVHHRVKNNLQVITSLLRMEGRRSAHPETKSVLGYMQGRIRSMALLHETLYRSGTFAGVDLAGYLKQLVTQAFRTHTTAPGTIQLELDLASVHVEMDQALPCGLLVNELVSNALKHAFPLGRTGILRLELQPVAGGPPWRLSVSDTGVGLPADFAARRGQSLGLQLVADLAGQLRGALEIGPAPTGSGTRFAVTFTPAAPKPAAPSPPEPLTPRP
jgi:two-component sensor histidine kinase